jgi:hypothetical protein
MIVIESRLKELFDTLPTVQVPMADGGTQEFTVKFDFGSTEDLTTFLKQEKAAYPLLWLETGFEEDHNTNRGEVSADLSFKIATSALKSSLLNQQRVKTTFDLVLFPVLENVRKAFERSNIVMLENQDWSVQKFYNWSTSNQLGTSQIWDAVKFDVSVVINGDCLRTPIYE